MRLKSLFLAGASVLAMTSVAHADPILTPLTLALFAGPLGAVFTPGIIYGALQIAGIAALGALQFALAPKTPKINPGQFKQTIRAEEASELNGIGRVRLGGVLALGNTKHPNIYRLLLHVRGPIDFTELFFLNGRETIIDENGLALTPPWVKSFTTAGSGIFEATTADSFVKIEQKAGDGTETAWPALKTDFSDLWTDDHRVRGIFQSLMTVTSPGIAHPYYLTLFSSGPEVEFECVVRTDTVHDPRDVAQDADDSATWKWNDNGVLCAIHIWRRDLFLNSTDFDWDLIKIEADRADVLVATKTGTEKRARCWGLWPSEARRGDVMEQVLDSIGGELKQTAEGKYWIRLIDENRPAEIEFVADDILELGLNTGPEAVERPNQCRVKYYSPERNYDMAEIDLTDIAWANVQSEIDAYGEKVFDIDLPFCPSASQAQRIARRLFAAARAETAIAKTRMDGWAAWGLSTVSFELPEFDETVVCEIGAPRGDPDQPFVEIPFAVQPVLTAWVPATDEADAPEPIPDIPADTDLVEPSAPTAAIHVEYSGGGTETRVDFAASVGATKYLAIKREYDADGDPEKWVAMTVPAGTTYGFISGDREGDPVDFRVMGFDASNNASNFSDAFSVVSLAQDNTAPGAPAVSPTAQSDGVDLAITPPDFNVVQMEVEYSIDAGPWFSHTVLDDVQPEIQRLASIDGINNPGPLNITLNWRVSSLTTNGTRGAYTSGSVVISP